MPAITVFFICPCFKKQSKPLFKQMVRTATETGITAPESQAGSLKCLLLWRRAGVGEDKTKQSWGQFCPSLQVTAHSLTLFPLGPTGPSGPTGPGSPFRPWGTEAHNILGVSVWGQCNKWNVFLPLLPLHIRGFQKKWCTPVPPPTLTKKNKKQSARGIKI